MGWSLVPVMLAGDGFLLRQGEILCQLGEERGSPEQQGPDWCEGSKPVTMSVFPSSLP